MIYSGFCKLIYYQITESYQQNYRQSEQPVTLTGTSYDRSFGILNQSNVLTPYRTLKEIPLSWTLTAHSHSTIGRWENLLQSISFPFNIWNKTTAKSIILEVNVTVYDFGFSFDFCAVTAVMVRLYSWTCENIEKV